MKKLISVLLLLAMVLGLFAGCGKNEEAAAGLQNAAEYLTGMYQTAGKDEAIVISADLDVLSSVVVDGVSYSVQWAVEVTEGDADSVTVSESAKENHVKLDVPLRSDTDILFTATATVSDAEGNTQAVTFDYKVKGAGMTMEELVEAAYALEEDQAMEEPGVLIGVVTMINTPYDEGYQNLTCTIVVEDMTDRPIKCYRLKGVGAENVAVGDTIAVSGILKNYGGTIEFDAGCVLIELIKSDLPDVEAPADPMQIIQDAYALEAGTSLSYSATLTGTITSVDTPYDAGYQNVTVTMAVTGAEDKPIKCYRLKGEGADRLAVGTVITVTGILMNYNGTVEFAQGCTLDAILSGDVAVAPTDQLAIVDEAYNLAAEATLPYTATLTGKITSIDTAYDTTYQNITVTIAVAGREQKPIQCYRMKGTGADTLVVGDTITVTGTIKNYGGKIQFDTGSTLVSVTKGDVIVTKPGTEVEIVDQAYKLQRDQSLPYTATLTGKVSYVKELYNSQYKNISVIIKVPGRENLPIVCYRMKGTDADKVAVNDTITVTGIIKNYNGSIQFDAGCNMDKRVSGGGTPAKQETDPMKIIDMAYALPKGQEMAYDVTLTGRVSSFKETYNTQYKSISVMFLVVGREAKPIQLYGLKGDGVENVAVGDTLTVVGRMKNYNDIIEMQPCTMTNRVSGGGKPPVTETTPASIMAAAKKLAENEELPYDVTLSGKVKSIDELYNAEYQSVCATIYVDGTSETLYMYNLKGTGVDQLAEDDLITVTGKIKNFYGKIELVSGEMTKRTSGGKKPPVAEKTPASIMAAAEKLGKDEQLPYEVTLSGKVTIVDTPYSEQYSNISFTIAVDGTSKTLLCYRVKGNDASKVVMNDQVTVKGYIKNYNGTKLELVEGEITSWKSGGGQVVQAPSDPKQIVDEAYALAPGAALPYTATLTGKIVSVDTEYSDQYNNITVTIAVSGRESKPIMCYRLKGNGIASLAVGNTITVTGSIVNYTKTDSETGVTTNTIEFNSGCTLVSVTKTMTGIVVLETQKANAPVEPRAAETNASKILNEAYALAEGESLSYQSTLTGKITSIKDPYNPSFSNISVWMEVAGFSDKPILAYRVAGTGAENLLVDDTITVTGTITNYKGTIEFAQGCTLDKVVSGGGTAPVAPEDPKQIVADAYALAEGATLPYKATLTGKITEIGTYNETYGDITLKIVVEGKDFECYALKGENLQELKVGDTITVTGTIKNYYGKVEFDKPNLDAVVKGEGGSDPLPIATKLYCQAPADWTECYIYTWDASNAATTGAWPGSLMNNEGNGLWSYEVPEAAANVIFNNGTGTQTDDMVKPTDSKIKYVYDTATWEELNIGGEGDDKDPPATTNEIIDAAYALESGKTLDGTYTLSGEVSSVDTPYDSFYNNITVTIKVPGSESKPIQCYRLAGEGADTLAVGDYITVTGSLTNYNGKVQFAQGCTLDKVIKGENEAPKAPEDPKQIVDEAYALEGGATLPYTATLTGKLTEIVEAYSEDYKNITVKLVIEGREDKPILCYRMKGEGVDALKVGDTITVTGTLKNYVKTDSESGETTSTIEFTPCTLVSVGENNQGGNNNNNTGDNNNTGNNSGTTQKTPAQIVAEAYALQDGQSLSYEATLTGKITSIDYAYSASSGDITVTITVEGKALKCYRMTGTGVDKIKVGDTITVKGKIKNYQGTIEFDKPVLTAVNDGANKAPGTGDYSLIAPIIVMMMSATCLVVLSKKKFYC